MFKFQIHNWAHFVADPIFNLANITLPVSHIGPMYPETQVQLYSLMPSVQFPPFLQVLDKQSSTSKSKMTQRHLIDFVVNF